MNTENLIQFLQYLRTENIISYLRDLDPLTLLNHPIIAVCLLVTLGALVCFRMMKTLAVVIGCMALWVAAAYTLPEDGTELSIQSIGIFAGICITVAALWIYILFIRQE